MPAGPLYRVALLTLAALMVAGCVRLPAGGEDLGLAAGDAGPGGGTVYYVATEPFPCGVAGERRCRYLEVSPPSAERLLPWSTGTNRSVPVPEARDTTLGSGLRNSLHVSRQEGNTPEAAAAVHALEYVADGGTDDWFLPSADELNELCKYARNQGGRGVDAPCDEDGDLLAGFIPGTYWSSSEAGENSAWLQNFSVGNQVGYLKRETYAARPVRAF